ncbi:MAG: cyclic nucleotide-binding domain-containing protein [Candidatus Glassbacteria bacterium]|nr:cyclic nucleotide-binding domain-containing protein [Candidatus Glassbacteria bacterium]
MAAAATNISFKPEDIIIRENTPGGSAYIILKGRVEVSKVIDGQRVVLDSLGPGSIFGEMSLIDGRPRSATVTALESTQLSIVDKARFQAILNAIPREVRPLFSSLSERLRHTNKLVSALYQRNRLIYSAYSMLSFMLGSIGERKAGVISVELEEVVYEACRVLAVDRERLEEVYLALGGTPLATVDNSSDETKLVVGDPEMLAAFVDYLAEKLSYIPGFPPPSRKFTTLSDNAQQVLFYLRNVAGNLPEDKHGYCHYDFDKYVKDTTSKQSMGVKDVIITLQNLSAAGHVRLEKFSVEVQNKAIVFRARDLSSAQMVMLQAEEFDRIYESL